MKTKSLFVCMMLVGLASCSGSKEEPFTGFDENTSTNTRQTDVEYPFYYFKGEKIGIELSDTKSYVLFREKDKEVLLNNLSERGVVFYEQHIRPFLQTQVSKKGDGYDKYIDCLWLEVDLNYKELNELPEVIYASPFVKASENGEWFPMTNKCYVHYYGDWDTLSKIVSDYNVEILGELASFENNYVILCTKESKGHALEVANALYETHLFAASQADFLDGMGD
ncbi:MAG: hypothetical protein J6S94_04070 [Bacteroidaceae bacterium]|nr:hypothetical protein [Bacteroidaceae bacterium]